MLIFLHIHKCGGSSLQSIIKKNYKTKKYINLSSKLDVVDALAQSIINSSKQNGYVMGHVCYGVHGLFPHPCDYATMLRRPTDRIVSLYLHAIRDKKSFYHKAAFGLSFEEFLKRKSVLELDNGMVRFLSGDPNGGYFINTKPFGELSQSDLDIAIKNLKNNISSFGLLEFFDLSLLLYQRELNINKIHYLKENESPATENKPIFSNEYENLIQYDKELYKVATHEFEKRVSTHQITGREINAFRRVNSILVPYFKTLRSVKKLLKKIYSSRLHLQ